MAEREAVDGSEHHFDRRKGDVNVSALATRVASLEGRVEGLEMRFQQNTTELAACSRLVRQVHEALQGRVGNPGIADKVDKMHEVFSAAEGGFKVLEFAGKVAKPIAYMVLLFGAIGTLFATGHWKWPT